MRMVITGCNGLLGQALIRTAPADGELLGTDLQPQGILLDAGRYRTIDLGDRRQTARVLQEFHPDWVLNAAAYTNVDGAEKERDLCWRANVTTVENLVHSCHRLRTKVCHVSTDYIFDGQHGPYDEEDLPNPIGFYGKSKLAGENVLRISGLEFCVARTMVLYGKARNVRPNFVTWLVDKLEKGEGVRIVDDQFGNTTLADELALGLWRVVEMSATGFFHIAGREIVDRYRFSLEIAEVFGLDARLIERITTADLRQSAPRPMRSGLKVDKALKTLGIELSDARGGLVKLHEQWHSI